MYMYCDKGWSLLQIEPQTCAGFKTLGFCKICWPDHAPDHCKEWVPWKNLLVSIIKLLLSSNDWKNDENCEPRTTLNGCSNKEMFCCGTHMYMVEFSVSDWLSLQTQQHRYSQLYWLMLSIELSPSLHRWNNTRHLMNHEFTIRVFLWKASEKS